MAGDPSLYDELDKAIAQARQALPADNGNVADSSTWTEEDQQALAELIDDHQTVQVHRSLRRNLGPANGPTFCAGCGEERPCPTAKELATKYGVTGDGERSYAEAPTMSRSEKDSDLVGRCACGLAGRQHHARVSRPGEPEQFVRSTFDCPATRPGPHFRID